MDGWMDVCMYASLSLSARVHVSTSACVCVCTYKYVYIYIYIYVCVCVYLCVCMNMCLTLSLSLSLCLFHPEGLSVYICMHIKQFIDQCVCVCVLICAVIYMWCFAYRYFGKKPRRKPFLDPSCCAHHQTEGQQEVREPGLLWIGLRVERACKISWEGL